MIGVPANTLTAGTSMSGTPMGTGRHYGTSSLVEIEKQDALSSTRRDTRHQTFGFE